MRLAAAAMCQIHTLSGSCLKNLHNLLTTKVINLGRLRRRTLTNKTFSTSNLNLNRIITTTTRNPPIGPDVATLALSNLNTSSTSVGDARHISSVEEKDISSRLTIFCFDIETTGFHRNQDRIIEFALRDLSGGDNSTFQTLVNPDKYVTNRYVHGISTYMVNKPGVPRMKELIPILVQYVKSRQKPGGKTILIAHNGKAFDVPFLISEFNRCGYEIPPDWLFLDTMALARHLIKAEGSKLSSKSLQALKEYYGITPTGKAHRAMSDVNVLALVLQQMTRDLKLTVACLLQKYTFTAPETCSSNSKKKKNSS